MGDGTDNFAKNVVVPVAVKGVIMQAVGTGPLFHSNHPNPDKPEPNAAVRFSFHFAKMFGLKGLKDRIST